MIFNSTSEALCRGMTFQNDFICDENIVVNRRVRSRFTDHCPLRIAPYCSIKSAPRKRNYLDHHVFLRNNRK